jgi:hypothetical protein
VPRPRYPGDREYNRRYYHEHKVEAAARSFAFRQANRTIARTIKEAGCIRCGESEYVALDFHHIDPNIKESNVSKLLAGASTKRMLKEIEKCVVICANCHRKLHAGLWSLEEYAI